MNIEELLKDPTLIQQYLEMAWPIIVNIALASVIVAIGWMASKWADRTATRALRNAHVTEGLARFLGTVVAWAVIAVALVGALGRLGIATTSLLTVLASAGLAIGLALKGTLGNFASGVVLLVFRPFAIDDSVEIQGVSGTVTDIGLWATTVRTFDGITVAIPNGEVTEGVIHNRSRHGIRRIAIEVGVDYDTPMAAAREALLRAARQVQLALDEPAPDVRFQSFGASSINFSVLIWVNASDTTPANDQLADAIYASLEEADIGIPFDQLVLHHDVPDAQAQAAK